MSKINLHSHSFVHFNLESPISVNGGILLNKSGAERYKLQATGMSQYPQKVQNKGFICHNCVKLFNKSGIEIYVVVSDDWYVHSM